MKTKNCPQFFHSRGGWVSGNIIDHINNVMPCWALLLLKWLTISRYTSLVFERSPMLSLSEQGHASILASLKTCSRITCMNPIDLTWAVHVTWPVLREASCRLSGVTRVGVTRGGNWRCQPYFFLKKMTTFLVIAVFKVMTFFSCPTAFVHCSF